MTYSSGRSLPGRMPMTLRDAWRSILLSKEIEAFTPSGTALKPFCLAAAVRVARSLPAEVMSCRSEEHTSAPVTNAHLVCRLLLEKKKIMSNQQHTISHNTDTIT